MGEHRSAKTAHSQMVRLDASASLIDRFMALVIGVSLPPGENRMAGWCSMPMTALAVAAGGRGEGGSASVEQGRRRAGADTPQQWNMRNTPPRSACAWFLKLSTLQTMRGGILL